MFIEKEEINSLFMLDLEEIPEIDKSFFVFKPNSFFR